MFKKITFFAIALIAVAAHAADIKGFRSAQFGNNEAEVRAAIKKDLKVADSQIAKNKDDVAGVSTLQVTLKSFEPLDLPATITYTLGYKCSCLVQVAINWDGANVARDPALFLNRLGALHGYLQRLGWEKDQVLTNKLLGEPKDGQDGVVLFFRGEDKNRAALSLLGMGVKVTTAKDASKNTDVNLDNIKSVVLVYDKNPQNPDLYTIEAGKF